MSLHDAYGYLYTAVLCVLAVLIVLCFIRAIKGPSIADRIVAINMIGTQIIIMIGVMTVTAAYIDARVYSRHHKPARS